MFKNLNKNKHGFIIGFSQILKISMWMKLESTCFFNLKIMIKIILILGNNILYFSSFGIYNTICNSFKLRNIIINNLNKTIVKSNKHNFVSFFGIFYLQNDLLLHIILKVTTMEKYLCKKFRVRGSIRFFKQILSIWNNFALLCIERFIIKKALGKERYVIKFGIFKILTIYNKIQLFYILTVIKFCLKHHYFQ